MPRYDIYRTSCSRAIPLRMRTDLEVVSHSCGGYLRLTAKDHLTHRYWQFSPEETFILNMLNGRTSTSDIRVRFEREFAPRRLPPDQLLAFLARLHREGLTITDRPGQADAILDRQQTGPLGVFRLLRHIFWWRFRGIDPDRWLARVLGRCRWIFSSPAAAAFVALVVSSLVLVLFQWPTLDRELSFLGGSFTADQALWVLAVIGFVKVLHELGHAIACKHFGGHCHEMGLMVFLGAPALYCDVSDAWMLPDKRSRVMISAAGILVEIALAAACAWIWQASQPGLVHSLALYVMIVCSVNTVLLNGNPLLQFDGYYMLADLTNTPNLRAEANSAVRRFAGRALLGLRLAPTGYIRGHGAAWLVVYGIFSTVYRWSVVFTALWFLHHVLEPYEMQWLSWVAGALVLGTMMSDTVLTLFRFVARPDHDREVPWRWVVPRSAIVCALGITALAIPLPHRIVCPVVVEPRDAQVVYVEVEGRLQWAIAAGMRVNEGDLLARLENLPLAAEIARLEGDRNVRQRRLQSFIRQQADPAVAAQIPASEKSLASTEVRLQQRMRDARRLEIRAPRSGVVLPRPARNDEDDRAATSSPTPLDEHNKGCYLKTGDVICMIGEPNEVDALMFVADDTRDLIATGQWADVFVNAFPQRNVTGAVAISPTSRTKTVPDELLARGELVADQASTRGHSRPKDVIYAARLELEPLDQPLLAGATGRAKVTVASQSLGRRAWRSLRQTFGAR